MIKVPANLAQALANYLITKPYQEVFQLLTALEKCEQVEESDQPESVEKGDPKDAMRKV